jgi:hypothetical protein
MKNIIIFIILAVFLFSLGITLFFSIDINTEKYEILFTSRLTGKNSYTLSYGQGLALRRVNIEKNSMPQQEIPGSTMPGMQDMTLPFEEGERLVYDIYSAGLKTGQAVLTFHGDRPFNGKDAYYITFVTELPLFKDYEEIYAQKVSFLPINIKRKIEKIGGFSAEDIEEVYDQDAFSVTIKKKGAFSTSQTTIQKDRHIYNAILLTYLCRFNPDMVHKSDFRAVLPTQKFNIIVSGEDTIETPSGAYPVDVFTSQPSKFTFYLSKDAKRLPVKITSHTALNYTMILNSVGNQG